MFSTGAGDSAMPSDAVTDEMIDEMNAVMQQGGTPMVALASDDMPAMKSPMTESPEIETLVEGSFIARSHPAEGTAVVLNDGTEQRFLRFENFATDNGPDLNVYLSTVPADGPVGDFDDDFVDLGDLKGNIGPQNYEIPTEVDLGRYSTVVIWCPLRRRVRRRRPHRRLSSAGGPGPRQLRS